MTPGVAPWPPWNWPRTGAPSDTPQLSPPLSAPQGGLCTPFSTPLSGSARETEDRIRNIFQYKKKRPPLLLFILACALALTCGGLVSCQPASGADSAPPTGLGISMDIQYYDTLGNYIEIPTLTLPSDTEPDEGITAINQALAELKAPSGLYFHL